MTNSGDNRRNAILLDPPYPNVKDRLYDHHDRKLLARCREFALAFASPSLKVALCGYEGDLEMPDDWEELPWGSQTGKGGSVSGSARTCLHGVATSRKLMRTKMNTLEVYDGVLFEGDWLPLAGMSVFVAKAMLKDAGNISYFADAIVNGRQVPVAHVLQPGDRLEFVQRFGYKASDDRPIEQAIGKAVVVAYPELVEIADKVKALNLPADRSLDLMAGMVAEWAEERFGASWAQRDGSVGRSSQAAPLT